MTIKLPLLARDLVEAAQAQLSEESERVHKVMLDEILPKAIDAILTYHAGSKEILRSNGEVNMGELTPVIAKTLWSYPGSFGATRISKMLEIEGLNKEAAESLTEAILNYTRYPMSIVNYMRHLGSSINSVNNIWNGPRASESVLVELGYSTEILPRWNAAIAQIDNSTIRDDRTFQEWLMQVEDFLTTFLPIQGRVNRYNAGRDIPPDPDRPRLGEVSLARAYVRRFGNFVAAHTNLNYQKSRSDGAAATVGDEFDKLLRIFSLSKREIFNELALDYESRASRISASVSKQVENTKMPVKSAAKGIEQNLNINGKKVEIRTSKATLPPSLVEAFMKSFILQQSLNPEQRVLSSRMLVDGDFIEVEVEKPDKSDLKKIQSFIESMYLS
ncbi:hypothetical protein MCEJIRE27_00496 [Candidatus Nanopelagicaceae bacterium]